MSYQAMDRWKFFVPLSFLLHIIIMLSLDIKLSMPIPDKLKPNKTITLILQAAPLPIKPPPVANNAPKPTLVKVEPEKTLPAPVVAKKVPHPVVAKTPPPTNAVRQRYIKDPPVQYSTVAKASVAKQSLVLVRRTPAPVQPARVSAPVTKSNMPDNMANLPRVGIPVQPQPAVITSNMPSDMQNLPRIGIPVQATTPVQPKPAISQRQPTVVQKVPVPNVVKSVAPPTPVQSVQKSIPPVPVPERIANTPDPEMSIPAPPVKQVPIETSQSTPVAVNKVKQSAFQQRLESLQDNVISFMPVFPQVVRLIAKGWLKDLEEITVPPVAPTPSRAVVQSVPVENSTEQTSQENAVSQTKPEAIPEQFMTDDRFHTKEVIQSNMDKDSLPAEQQGKSGKKLGSIIFKERKNYGDITPQEESAAQNIKKHKGEGFSIPIGDCYVGSKTEVEEGQSGEHKNPINCNF
ncbi:MAG: hypothetical protein QX189_12680 [Methylococcales bacterium]